MLRIFLVPLISLLLAGCDEDVAAPGNDPVRAIKYMTLDARAGLQERRIAGVVAAEITSNVAFETGGRVIELLRGAGDAVATGDLLGRLDPEPYDLQVGQARAELTRAVAAADNARKKFSQQKRLLDQGFATRTAYDTAEANLRGADGAVDVAQSVLDRAKRDLSKTDLKAPFSGVIARRSVEVFEEVTGGQPVYSIQTAEGGNIVASLPETMVNRVSLGTRIEVAFPPLGDARVTGTVAEIAPLTGEANAYPIKVTLDRTPPGLHSGMSAELTFRFSTETTGQAFLVPLATVRPSVSESGAATVFVFDPGSGTIAERPVRIVNIEGNRLQIIGQLETGDIIATAGVSFLHDGMPVVLLDPETLR